MISFIVVLAQDPRQDAINCTSLLWEADAGLGVHVGTGLGVCFSPRPSFVYIEFTIGGGIGAGMGFNFCATFVAEVEEGTENADCDSGATCDDMEGAAERQSYLPP